MSEVVEYLLCRPSQLETAIAKVPIAYIPFGALEWHSYHSPLGLDGLKAEALCRRAAQKTGGVLFPCVYWGAFGTLGFPHTFHFSKSSMVKQTWTMLNQLWQWGFRVVVCLTGHYPRGQVMQLRHHAMKLMKKYKDFFVLGIPEYSLTAELGYDGDHAAKWETSIMLSLFPDLMDVAALPQGLSYIDRARQLGIEGGDPTIHASRELGDKVVAHIVEKLADAVQKTYTTRTRDAFDAIYAIQKERMKIKYLRTTAREEGLVTMHDQFEMFKWMFLKGSRQETKIKNEARPR